MVGVVIEAGILKSGTPLTVPTKSVSMPRLMVLHFQFALSLQFTDIGVVSSIEVNHKTVDSARKGEEVCIKVAATGGDAPRLYGRHFDHTDLLVSKVCKSL